MRTQRNAEFFVSFPSLRVTKRSGVYREAFVL